MSVKKIRFEQVRTAYESLEPGASDAWNPVGSTNELAYRLMLYYAAVRAFERAQVSPPTTDVLDIGCGNGRSSRLYVDLGVSPERVTGVGLRANAIACARRLNPAIRFELADGFPLSVGDPVGWASLSTVVSSVSDVSERREILQEAWRHVAPGGFPLLLRSATGQQLRQRRSPPTAACSPPSHPAEIRRAAKFRKAR